ncbi:MAG TPA: hypothetical protein VFE06_16600 [Acidobacteriaceae bacterium]|nr:hypothetical protein [Acidobacteriaceae bacterium]
MGAGGWKSLLAEGRSDLGKQKVQVADKDSGGAGTSADEVRLFGGAGFGREIGYHGWQ